MRAIVLFAVFLSSIQQIHAQTPTDTLPAGTIAPTTIVSTYTFFQNPHAINRLQRDWIQRAQAQRSLADALALLPGVHAWNTENYSADLRISIRGYGARAAFGVRGIRIFTDGVPETSPDGQTDLDNVDVGNLGSITLFRGPMGGLYGNAAGGALLLSTADDRPRATEVTTTAGSFGFYRAQAKTVWNRTDRGGHVQLSHTRLDGYRAQGRMRQTNINARLYRNWGERVKARLLLNAVQSPLAEDAGGLTLIQRDTMPQMARAANVQFNAGEQVSQYRVGLVVTGQIKGNHRYNVMAFATHRDFANRLPFLAGGWVEFNRNFGGSRIDYEYVGEKFQHRIGVEMGLQRDQRQRFNNQDGVRGERTFQQREQFEGIGVFWFEQWAPIQKLNINATARYDRVRLSSRDRFLTDGDQSGEQHFNRFNPSLGILWQMSKKLHLWTNLSPQFETPTLSELSANPNGGGFEPNLKPQTSFQREIGIRTPLQGRWEADLAVFDIRLRNEIVPYQLADQPGRTFFRNAGRSSRRGLEASLRGRIVRGLEGMAALTGARYRYLDYEAAGVRYDGNTQPAIPVWRGALALRYQRGPVYAILQAEHQTSRFAADDNVEEDPAFTLLNCRLAYQIKVKKAMLEPFVGVNNLLGASYSNNILINAVGKRYFEPAPPMATWFGGVTLRLE